VSGPPHEFVTARLDAQRVSADDLPFLVSVFSDARVTRTLGGPRDEARIRDDVARWNRHWDEFGSGLWILRRREDATPVGWTMLHRTDTGGPGVEVGWTIAADHWRAGYASEAGGEAVRIGFDDLGLAELVSFTLADNLASRGVMEKLGFRYDAEVEHAGLPHVLYRLDREQWGQWRHG
jgi:RimJ/RimL family protein N-acetyltransferase